MPKRRRSLATIPVSLALGLVLCGAFRSEAAEPSADTIMRGKALVVAGDCASCHTADPARPFAGGKRIETRFGGIYTPNLTPDRETGLGSWREQWWGRGCVGCGRCIAWWPVGMEMTEEAREMAGGGGHG